MAIPTMAGEPGRGILTVQEDMGFPEEYTYAIVGHILLNSS